MEGLPKINCCRASNESGAVALDELSGTFSVVALTLVPSRVLLIPWQPGSMTDKIEFVRTYYWLSVPTLQSDTTDRLAAF